MADFFSANLFTVIVIAEPFSTDWPSSKLCFKTAPFSLELSSAFVTVTTKPKSWRAFFASSWDFPTTPGTVAFSVPVLTWIFNVSPAFTSVLASVSWLNT